MRKSFNLASLASALLFAVILWFALIGNGGHSRAVDLGNSSFRIGYDESGFIIYRGLSHSATYRLATQNGQYTKGAIPGISWFWINFPQCLDLFVAYWVVLILCGVLPLALVVDWVKRRVRTERV